MLWVLAEGQHHPSRYTPSNQKDEAGGLRLTSAWQLPSLKFQMGLLIRVLDKGEGITVICLGIQGDLKNGRGSQETSQATHCKNCDGLKYRTFHLNVGFQAIPDWQLAILSSIVGAPFFVLLFHGILPQPIPLRGLTYWDAQDMALAI